VAHLYEVRSQGTLSAERFLLLNFSQGRPFECVRLPKRDVRTSAPSRPGEGRVAHASRSDGWGNDDRTSKTLASTATRRTDPSTVWASRRIRTVAASPIIVPPPFAFAKDGPPAHGGDRRRATPRRHAPPTRLADVARRVRGLRTAQFVVEWLTGEPPAIRPLDTMNPGRWACRCRCFAWVGTDAVPVDWAAGHVVRSGSGWPTRRSIC